MIRILGGISGSSVDVKYEAKGSLSRSTSSCSSWEDSPFGFEEDEGSAVRIEGSNSRVLSNVRGMFSARRF